jgi:ATP-dependent protease HslVU (ClpYQ) peptidase subunit
LTVIAWDKTTIASDSQVTTGERIYAFRPKILKTKGGGIVGAAGPMNVLYDYVKWFNGEIEAPEYTGEMSYRIVYIDPSKKIWMYYSTTKSVCPAEKIGAIGSGEDYAITALDLGLTAEQAVAVAIKRDVFSGGKIRSIRYRD